MTDDSLTDEIGDQIEKSEQKDAPITSTDSQTAGMYSKNNGEKLAKIEEVTPKEEETKHEMEEVCANVFKRRVESVDYRIENRLDTEDDKLLDDYRI